MVAANISELYAFGNQAALMNSSYLATSISLLAIGLAVIPIMNYFASRREEKRRIREVAAIERQTRAFERQAIALYTISTQYNLVKRK